MSEHSLLLTCRLTDRFGNPINPYFKGSVTYTPEFTADANSHSVSIEGYVAVYAGKVKISPPFPFCITSQFELAMPKDGTVNYSLVSFHTWVAQCRSESTSETGQINLLISIGTYVSSQKAVDLLVPRVDKDLCVIGSVCINANQIYDSGKIHGECCILCKNAGLRVKISQYNAISDGKKRSFRNSDAVKGYGGLGILSPDEVSYFNVFVNGVLQPKANYILKKGDLTFKTKNIPSKGQTVIILFVTWGDQGKAKVNAVEWQYSAMSDGRKKIYTNGDELPCYKSRGIPSPCEVSYFNLYVNGVLQPKKTYSVRKGVLKLLTCDAPSKGALVILESVVICDPMRRLFRIKNLSYNAYSNGGKIYTDRNEIAMYGMSGISGPTEFSYQNLFVNGVLQPHANYNAHKGCLILETVDSPTVRAPITLQTICSSAAVPYCKTQFSKRALMEWEKKFGDIKHINDAQCNDKNLPFGKC